MRSNPNFQTSTSDQPEVQAVKNLKTRSRKWKGKKPRDAVDGHCHLLTLPPDLLWLLLSRLPPRSLLNLSATCKELHDGLQDDSIWRESFIHRFMQSPSRNEVKVLVQGCKNTGGRGWRKEALSREAMLDRWTTSKAAAVTHHPPVGLIHSLSLSYPPFVPSTRPLVVGNKMTHRDKYEALLAATTRPAPYILSAGLDVGGVVKSDPFSGKISKGYWGPGREANLHLRPHLDPTFPPSSVFLPRRSQTHLIWGLLTGSCVHTTISSRASTSRASSVNVYSDPSDAHEGAILDIWMPEGSDRWVTAGADGRVKYWQLERGATTKGATPNFITCLFSSDLSTPMDRPDEIKRRQVARPDPVILARCDATQNVICAVTEEGDLRVWHGKETRLDVGPGVDRLELDVSETISVIIHHRLAPYFTRYDITDGGSTVFSAESPITCLAAYPSPTPQISAEPSLETFGRLVIAGDESGRLMIWNWEGEVLRSWTSSVKITSIDMSCGLIAVGSYDGAIKVYDLLPNPPDLLRTFHGAHLSPADQIQALSGSPEARYYNVNNLILENDLVMGSIGRRIVAWRAGNTKTRGGGKDLGRRVVSGGKEARGNRTIDIQSLNEDASDALLEATPPSRQERQQIAALENLGLDGDEALQYALLMSQEDQEDENDVSVDSEMEAAIRAVEEFQRKEDEEVARALEQIRLAEE